MGDVTYIEECQYVTRTYCHEEQETNYHHSRIVGHDSRVVGEYHEDHYGHDDYHKRSAQPGGHHYTGPQCQDKQEQEFTSILMKTLARSPRQLARKLLIPSTLRSVRKLSILFVRSLMNSIITVNMLLVMNLMWLVIQMVIMRVM